MAQYDFDYDGELRLKSSFSPFHVQSSHWIFIEFNQSIWSGQNERRKAKWKTIIAQCIYQSHSQAENRNTKHQTIERLKMNVRLFVSIVRFARYLSIQSSVQTSSAYNHCYQFPMFQQVKMNWVFVKPITHLHHRDHDYWILSDWSLRWILIATRTPYVECHEQWTVNNDVRLSLLLLLSMRKIFYFIFGR